MTSTMNNDSYDSPRLKLKHLEFYLHWIHTHTPSNYVIMRKIHLIQCIKSLSIYRLKIPPRPIFTIRSHRVTEVPIIFSLFVQIWNCPRNISHIGTAKLCGTLRLSLIPPIFIWDTNRTLPLFTFSFYLYNLENKITRNINLKERLMFTKCVLPWLSYFVSKLHSDVLSWKISFSTQGWKANKNGTYLQGLILGAQSDPWIFFWSTGIAKTF